MVMVNQGCSGRRLGLRPWQLMLLFAAILLLPDRVLALCSKPTLSGQLQTLTFEAIERHFRVAYPKDYAANVNNPMVVVLHGWGGDENSFLSHEAFTQYAEKRGVVLVAPRGLGSGAPDHQYNAWTFSGSATGVTSVGAPICEVDSTPDYRYPSCKMSGTAQTICAWTHCQSTFPSDTAFLLALIKHLEAKLCIDPDRVYLMGGSNGGNLIWDVARLPPLADKLAAMASLIGLPHESYGQFPALKRLPPALLVTGLRDDTDPPGPWDSLSATTTSNGGDRYFYESASATIRNWSKASGCAVGTKARRVPAPQPFDCRVYCQDEIEEVPALDCRLDMAHEYQLDTTWPLTLDFLLRHQR